MMRRHRRRVSRLLLLLLLLLRLLRISMKMRGRMREVIGRRSHWRARRSRVWVGEWCVRRRGGERGRTAASAAAADRGG